jgi:hypothetical protein
MSRDYQVPAGIGVVETGTRDYQVPAGIGVVETTSTSAAFNAAWNIAANTVIQSGALTA